MIQSAASFSGLATRLQRCVRPVFSRESNPARSSMRRCLEIAGSDMSNGFANCVTDDSPSASCSRIARRVGSASAEKVAFKRAGELLTIWLTIEA